MTGGQPYADVPESLYRRASRKDDVENPDVGKNNQREHNVSRDPGPRVDEDSEEED